MDYFSQGKLSIAGVLFRFINNELLPGTHVDPKAFWDGIDKCFKTGNRECYMGKHT